ncbi:hypothetical protein ACMSI6_12605 [Pseudomonas antarctica]|uniref:Lipoprotein n=1 Tax=Pseudomonas antarctica TaxID=219572 RepID=A0A1G9YVR8_9PSED|nr:hypothetical protein [Pseudomonas antarctica]KAF2410795.1 hypothetical protein PSAN_32280 [Pseudomonas antarctica]SDN12651.1 hypothetical protein SAMN04490179_2647 [Pseudomonas antarctica]
MSILRVMPVTLLVLLTGCGQVANIRSLSTAYAPPQSGETARVRLITDGLVRAVPGRDCLDWKVPGAGVMASTKAGFADRNGESLGMPGPIYTWDGAVTTELVVPANKPIALHYLGQLQYSRQCFSSMTFVPRPGADYMVQATIYAGCSIQLQALSADGKQWDAVEPEPKGKLSMCNAMDNF